MICRQRTYKFLGVQDSVCRKSHAECTVVESVNCVGCVCRLRWQICNPGESHCAALGFLFLYKNAVCIAMEEFYTCIISSIPVACLHKTWHTAHIHTKDRGGGNGVDYALFCPHDRVVSFDLCCVFIYFFISLFSYEHLWSTAGPWSSHPVTNTVMDVHI